MKRWIVIAAATLAVVLGVGAGALAGADPDPGPGGARVLGPGRLHEGMHAMHGSRIRSERAWLTEMVAHHEEAIEAAGELRRSDRRAMRRFGAAIVADQSAQVALMEGWLDTWYGAPDPAVDYEPMMRDLTGLSGDRLDRVFLQDMVRHHMMAVMAAQRLLVSGVDLHEEVADLAREIRDVQHREIVRMHRWLADWFGGRGGMGPGIGPGMMHAR